ncbi:amidohydrolase [Dethiosulfatibacter aminovorans DSM 17477]|uniref:Amidohydrolase n=1 Tax=Dethiosulfatibacter aminovorans DSM 17477 TaxID=1121476 RepID=A0A1M6BS34_9FIRM|nr:amidohydrolase [Dethiosulfatibacter aminovorans]SHI51516.1 amidohydrolase [Dethiosulfatibacter aminovorans DSM 17477]
MNSETYRKQREYVIRMRREFHENPETSWNETRTQKRIIEELEGIGLHCEKCAGTGVVATIKGEKPGRTVALRADIDALEIGEASDVEYRSKKQGLMHACGHDGHAAMLLGAARALVESRDELKGNVRLLFQPAEETLRGAKKMIEDGALDGVDAIMGQHLWNNIPAGKVNVESGPRMASGDPVIIDFYGKGGHGSLPNETVDPVVMASSFIMNSNAMLSREKYPMEPMVLTFGEVKCGTRFNIIPDEAHLEGSLRCFSQESRESAWNRIREYAECTASMFGGRAEVNIPKGTPATINDEVIAMEARKVAEKVAGSDNIMNLEKTTGSEDMAYYLDEIPGAMVFVGSGFEDRETFPHHHPRFDINEDALEIGTGMYYHFAIDYLNSN